MAGQRGDEVKARIIATKIWSDKKFRELTWLEKAVFLHLLLREEMTTIGAVTIGVESIEIKMNQPSGRNRVTPAYPRILMRDILRAISALERKQMIATQNSGALTVYFYHFLDHNKWAKSVFTQFPELVEDQIPEGPIQEVIKLRTIGWMEENKVEVPEVWR